MVNHLKAAKSGFGVVYTINFIGFFNTTGDSCRTKVTWLILRAGFTFQQTNIPLRLHNLECISHLATAQLHRFDDPEEIFTYCVKRWCIFSHTKAVDQRDVAEHGCDLPASCDNLRVLSARARIQM